MIKSEPFEKRQRADVRINRQGDVAFGKYSGNIRVTLQTSRFRVISRVNRWKAGS